MSAETWDLPWKNNKFHLEQAEKQVKAELFQVCRVDQQSLLCNLSYIPRDSIKAMFYRLLILVIHGYVKTSISKLLFTLILAKEALKTETEAGYSATTV